MAAKDVHDTKTQKTETDNKLESGQGTLVFLDLEATGLPGSAPKITEVSMVAVHSQTFLDFSKDIQESCIKVEHVNAPTEVETPPLPRVMSKILLPVYPGKLINPTVEQITGLSNYNLEKERKFDSVLASLIERFLDVLSDPIYLIAHNGNRFDFPLLKKQLSSAGSTDFDVFCCDSLDFFRQFYSEDRLANTQITNGKVTSADSRSRSRSPRPNVAKSISPEKELPKDHEPPSSSSATAPATTCHATIPFSLLSEQVRSIGAHFHELANMFDSLHQNSSTCKHSPHHTSILDSPAKTPQKRKPEEANDKAEIELTNERAEISTNSVSGLQALAEDSPLRKYTPLRGSEENDSSVLLTPPSSVKKRRVSGDKNSANKSSQNLEEKFASLEEFNKKSTDVKNDSTLDNGLNGIELEGIRRLDQDQASTNHVADIGSTNQETRSCQQDLSGKAAQTDDSSPQKAVNGSHEGAFGDHPGLDIELDNKLNTDTMDGCVNGHGDGRGARPTDCTGESSDEVLATVDQDSYRHLRQRPRDFKQTTLYAHAFGLVPERSHNAEADCLALMQLLAAYQPAFFEFAEKNSKHYKDMKSDFKR